LAQGKWISEVFLPDFLLKRKKRSKKRILDRNGFITPLEEIEKDHIMNYPTTVPCSFFIAELHALYCIWA
jgi:hypothetical protein